MTAAELVRSRVNRRVATREEWRALHRLERVLARPPGIARMLGAYHADLRLQAVFVGVAVRRLFSGRTS